MISKSILVRRVYIRIWANLTITKGFILMNNLEKLRFTITLCNFSLKGLACFRLNHDPLSSIELYLS